MKNPNFSTEKTGYKNTYNYKSQRKYLQFILIREPACEYIGIYEVNLKKYHHIESDTEVYGIGPYFSPFIREGEIYCMCLGPCDLIPSSIKLIDKVGNLHPLVESLRSELGEKK